MDGNQPEDLTSHQRRVMTPTRGWTTSLSEPLGRRQGRDYDSVEAHLNNGIKHIDIRHHFLGEIFKHRKLELVHISSQTHVANVLT